MTEPTFTLRITKNGTKLATEDTSFRITPAQRDELHAWLAGVSPQAEPVNVRLYDKLRLLSNVAELSVRHIPPVTNPDVDVLRVCISEARGALAEAERLAGVGSSPAQPDMLRKLRGIVGDRMCQIGEARNKAERAGREGVANCRQSDIETLEWVRGKIDELVAAAAPKEESGIGNAAGSGSRGGCK